MRNDAMELLQGNKGQARLSALTHMREQTQLPVLFGWETLPPSLSHLL